jgi:hypothetical protein
VTEVMVVMAMLFAAAIMGIIEAAAVAIII